MARWPIYEEIYDALMDPAAFFDLQEIQEYDGPRGALEEAAAFHAQLVDIMRWWHDGHQIGDYFRQSYEMDYDDDCEVSFIYRTWFEC